MKHTIKETVSFWLVEKMGSHHRTIEFEWKWDIFFLPRFYRSKITNFDRSTRIQCCGQLSWLILPLLLESIPAKSWHLSMNAKVWQKTVRKLCDCNKMSPMDMSHLVRWHICFFTVVYTYVFFFFFWTRVYSMANTHIISHLIASKYTRLCMEYIICETILFRAY